MSGKGTVKIKAISKRALEIREQGGFTTETIVKKRYKVAYIPDAVKQAAKELKTPALPVKMSRDAAFKKAKDVKSENALSKLIRMDDGRVVTKKQFVELLVANGAVPGYDMVNKIKDMSRLQYFRANQQQQDAHERRQKEAGKVPEYFLKRKNGVYSTINKTEYDYALMLMGAIKSKSSSKSRTVKTSRLSRRVGENTKAGVKVVKSGISEKATSAIRSAIKLSRFSDIDFASGKLLYSIKKVAGRFTIPDKEKRNAMIVFLLDAGYIETLNFSGKYKVTKSGAEFIKTVDQHIKNAKTDKFNPNLFK